MEYFYVSPGAVTPEELTIDGEEFAHMTHVMRMREGDSIRAVDGAGHCYDAVIGTILKGKATCRITGRADRLHEPARKLTLGAGMLKNPSRFDYLVEKAVEIGASGIVPLVTERTIPRQGKTERWRKLCLAAMKQSGRCVLTEVAEPVAFETFLSSAEAGAVKFIPHESAALPLTGAVPPGASPLLVAIGPEGGFTGGEIEAASGRGFTPVSLGERRLRTETAALVACTILLQGGREGHR